MNYLKQLRAKSLLTQIDLSERTEISQSRISRLEALPQDEFFKSVTAWELEQIHYNVTISDDVFKVLSACSIVRII